MHEISWQCGGERQTQLHPDGLCPAPAGWPGPVMVIADQQAARLVVGRRAQVLAAGVEASLGGGRTVRWQPARPARPAPLGREATELAPERTCTIQLFLAGGGIEREVDGTLTLVGRHPACDVRLDDAQLSSWHCALQRTAAGVRLIDLGSRNGTWVDGARVSAATLSQRANLRLGTRRLLLRPAVQAPTRVELRSAPMRALAALVRRVAPTDVSVLIQGETGVGKDELARQLHALSERRGPFIALNAAAIPPTLASSELFGYVKGAFTGAERDHDGAFLAAHDGTLFLDEIAELPLTTQAELLRVVELKRVRRLGELGETPVDVRLVAATHADLAAAVRQGAFRADLFHRLCVLPLVVPPLRERPDDLVQLAEHFLAAQPAPRALSPAAVEHLVAHPWPGNVRELFNVLWRACVTTDQTTLEPRDLTLAHTGSGRPPPANTRGQVVETYRALGQNVTATARELRMTKSAVYRHLRTAQLKPAAVDVVKPPTPAHD